MEEKEELPKEENTSEEKLSEEIKEEEVIGEEEPGKIDYAKKWFIACIVLFVILIILAIVLKLIPHNDDIWNGGSIPASSPKELFHF